MLRSASTVTVRGARGVRGVRCASHARQASIPLIALATQSPAFAVGLRRVPAFRSYATETSTSTSTASTTTTTPPPPSTSEKPASVSVPPPGSPAPAPPTSAAPAADEKAVSVETSEKDVAKKEKKPTGPLYKRAWAVVKKEAAHYWAGTKLLGHEIAISSKLQYKVLKGGSLTRRERRQLRRTVTDLLRLLPFSIFIIIPFMEVLLPVALKLFPNMLPSTFEGQLAKDEKERKLLRVRIEMAKFLQETVRDSGLKADSVLHSDEFKEFFRKVRATGEKPSTNDVIRVGKLFTNEITLDNLSRPQLVSMCRYMNINAFGTDNFLKHQIRARLEKIRVDDMMISAEGVDSLSTKELQQACQSRGIRFQGMSPSRLREELEQWIDLHYTNGISGVLLILSRAFNFENKGDDVMSSLITTLSSLPENLINETELNVSDEATYKQKLDVLREQQELIEDEAEQEQMELEARKEKKEKKEAEEAARLEEEAEKAAAAAAATTAAAQAASPEIAATTGATGAEPGAAAATSSSHPSTTPPTESKPPSVESLIEDAKMTKEQIMELAEALSILTAKSSIVKERDELQALFADNLLSEAESKERPDETDSKTVALSKRVRGMIKKIDAQLESYAEKVGSSLNLIETNSKGQISMADLKAALGVIKHAPNQELVDAISQKLDPDGDGFVELDHVLDLAQDDGLGIVLDDVATTLLDKGHDIRHSKDLKDLRPKREDIIAE